MLPGPIGGSGETMAGVVVRQAFTKRCGLCAGMRAAGCETAATASLRSPARSTAVGPAEPSPMGRVARDAGAPGGPDRPCGRVATAEADRMFLAIAWVLTARRNSR